MPDKKAGRLGSLKLLLQSKRANGYSNAKIQFFTMYLTNSKRVRKVLLNLALHPFDIPFYLKKSLSSKSPLELGLPWWSLSSIRYVQRKVNPKLRVFEWGSGGSTLFLGKRFSSVTSIEHEPVWLEKVEAEIKKQSLTSVSVHLSSINLDNKSAFEKCPYFLCLKQEFDVVIVDGEDHFGPDSTWSSRVSCFKRAEKFIAENGVIIVDDSWRYPEIRKASKAKRVDIHEGIGPCRKGVTSTDLHFY